MDKPIVYFRPRRPNVGPQSRYEALLFCIQDDDKAEFLRLLKDPSYEKVIPLFRTPDVFDYDPLEIVTAIINGEMKGFIEPQHVLVLEDGMTPLHLAAAANAPRLTHYFLQRGDNVDAVCHHKLMDLKHATPIDVALGKLVTYSGVAGRRPWTSQNSIFELLYYVCEIQRRHLEVLRLLVRKTQNKEHVMTAFSDYARKGQLVELAALFFAAPELFLSTHFVTLGGGLSPYSKLYLELNSLNMGTDIQEGMALLLDVLAAVGDKLVAYIRLEDPRPRCLDA